MFLSLFNTLKTTGVPCTLRELLDLNAAVEKNLVFADMQNFYYLSRAILVKDEKHYDKFDRAFDIYFKGIESIDDVLEMLIPEEWLKAEFQKFLSEEELAEIESLGGLEKLLEEFKKRMEEQKDRHEGGSKWVGTGGTSPFGNNGEHPEGIRVGGEGKQKKAVKVWEAREFKNLDDDVELGTRNIKVALRRLRKMIRDSAEEEFDLDETIGSTAKKAGLLDIKYQPEKRNAVKVLALFDVGGSMDPHVKICEELFSACKTEFKNFPHASAACLSGKEIESQLKTRLDQLREVDDDELNSYLDEHLEKVLSQMLARAQDIWPDQGFASPLDREFQILSPSDFGFHNILKCKEGKLVFYDFEYFGWDDPAKLVGDFVLHPGMNLTNSQKKHWIKGAEKIFGSIMLRRMSLMWPLLGLCWCLILLNDFRQDYFLRRNGSAGEQATINRSRLMYQLTRSEQLLGEIQSQYKNISYVS